MGVETVLVVGGAGYIGAHMVKALAAAGYRVVILDDLSTGHREFTAAGRFIHGSLGDRNVLDALFSEHPIDAVMHFAAFSLVGESVKNPLAYYRNNLAGTLSLLEAMIRFDVKRFIFSSTAAVYGEPTAVPITEDHPCVPTNPYGATKLAVERMLKDCDAAYDLRYMSLRYFNAAGADPGGLIGERHQPESHLIPLVLKTALGELPHIGIFGTRYPTPDGTCLRDYVHVNDLAQAHLLALKALLDGRPSGVYNLGNSKGYSVREVIELSRRITGRPIPAIETGNRPGDPAILVAASEKIRRELGWQPEYEDLETIIQTAWQWHQRERDRNR
ncbi:MAG: UDP-glucose 4-epimerase GalE [Pseudomonadota bacterium]